MSTHNFLPASRAVMSCLDQIADGTAPESLIPLWADAARREMENLNRQLEVAHAELRAIRQGTAS